MITIKRTREEVGDNEFGYCRKLVAEGVEPNSILEVYTIRDTPDITIHNVGIASKWDCDGEKIRKYRDRSLKGGETGGAASQSDLND